MDGNGDFQALFNAKGLASSNLSSQADEIWLFIFRVPGGTLRPDQF